MKDYTAIKPMVTGNVLGTGLAVLKYRRIKKDMEVTAVMKIIIITSLLFIRFTSTLDFLSLYKCLSQEIKGNSAIGIVTQRELTISP